jgi:hypothetical protein
MIPKEWLEDYFKKSGDTEIDKSGNLVVLPFGFCVWTINENGDLLLLQVYVTKGQGNGRKMDAFTIELAKRISAKKIVFATKRNPKGFIRKYGYNLVGYILEKEVKNEQCC